jgi:hypothetical protein
MAARRSFKLAKVISIKNGVVTARLGKTKFRVKESDIGKAGIYAAPPALILAGLLSGNEPALVAGTNLSLGEAAIVGAKATLSMPKLFKKF